MLWKNFDPKEGRNLQFLQAYEMRNDRSRCLAKWSRVINPSWRPLPSQLAKEFGNAWKCVAIINLERLPLKARKNLGFQKIADLTSYHSALSECLQSRFPSTVAVPRNSDRA